MQVLSNNNSTFECKMKPNGLTLHSQEGFIWLPTLPSFSWGPPRTRSGTTGYGIRSMPKVETVNVVFQTLKILFQDCKIFLILWKIIPKLWKVISKLWKVIWISEKWFESLKKWRVSLKKFCQDIVQCFTHIVSTSS